MKKLEDPASITSIFPLNQSSLRPSARAQAITSKKVAQISTATYLLLSQLEIYHSQNSTCYQVKKGLNNPWIFSDLIEFYGALNEYIFWGFKMFQQFGIDRKLYEMEKFQEMTNMRIQRSR